MTGEPAVLAEPSNGVLIITINRPEVRNAVNREVSAGMIAAISRLDEDPELRVGILTGAGRGFCTGMDLKAFARGESALIGDRGFAGITHYGSRKPLIAAIEGFSLGGGLEMALTCDIIVAAKGSQLGLPEVKHGLYAAAGGLLRLPRRMNAGDAAILALTGEPVDAEEGYRLGLVNRLVDPGQALPEAIRLAEAIARNAPLAVVATKRVLTEGRTKPDDEFFAWEHAEPELRSVLKSKDALEGATAFSERREPVWVGARPGSVPLPRSSPG